MPGVVGRDAVPGGEEHLGGEQRAGAAVQEDAVGVVEGDEADVLVLEVRDDVLAGDRDRGWGQQRGEEGEGQGEGCQRQAGELLEHESSLYTVDASQTGVALCRVPPQGAVARIPNGV